VKCRHCNKPLIHQFLDLGFAPPSNAYLSPSDLHTPEMYFPLKLYVCTTCWLVQTEDYADSEKLFTADYAYFSSTSTGWLRHASAYCDSIINQLQLSNDHLVIEVAANDGYLLRNFLEKNIPCLGIEPTDSTADAAEKLGIPIIREFFGNTLASRLVSDGNQADLIIGNNVFAHVPDINDFTKGLKTTLKPGGTITLEFPHLLNLIRLNQFDTVYHEHYSYLSLYVVRRIFKEHGLRIFDVKKLTTHGGSLRVYGCHDNDPRPINKAVDMIVQEEEEQGLRESKTYQEFQGRANFVKNTLLEFLLEQKQKGKLVAGYGAAAKGNTLLNYAGIKPDLLPFICDAAPSKQGSYMPGSHIPILHPDTLKTRQPDYVIILPWNIADEVIRQNTCIRDWGGKFVVTVPELKIL